MALHIDFTITETLVGRLLIASSEKGVIRIAFQTDESADPVIDLKQKYPESAIRENHEVNREATDQIREYLDGKRTAFYLPLELNGTPFQKKVWDAVVCIPYGQTRSYGEIACAIDNPKSCRAVGNANNKNPLPIIIPCHRIIGSDGSMTGYGGGMPIKKKLLELEKRVIESESSFL